jgi:hypothetical protein
LDTAILAPGDCCNILHDTLSSFGLSCTRFSSDDHTLILVVCVHVVVSGFSDTVYVWRNLQPVLAFVTLEDGIGVYAQIYPALAATIN